MSLCIQSSKPFEKTLATLQWKNATHTIHATWFNSCNLSKHTNIPRHKWSNTWKYNKNLKAVGHMFRKIYDIPWSGRSVTVKRCRHRGHLKVLVTDLPTNRLTEVGVRDFPGKWNTSFGGNDTRSLGEMTHKMWEKWHKYMQYIYHIFCCSLQLCLM